MSGRSDESLAAEAARRRRELRVEQDRHAATRAMLEDANRLLLAVALCDRLADPRDFDLIVGMDQVVDVRGSVDWNRVDALVEVLLEERPHLAAPRGDAPWRPGSTALQWMQAET